MNRTAEKLALKIPALLRNRIRNYSESDLARPIGLSSNQDWTVGITDKWVNEIGITGQGNDRYYISIDTSYGNGDGIMTMDELDAFYDANGYTVTDSSSADIMYYSKYHGARKKRCSDGAGKWEMFESKCGALERIEHLRDQLNGDSYGFPVRYYKAK